MRHLIQTGLIGLALLGSLSADALAASPSGCSSLAAGLAGSASASGMIGAPQVACNRALSLHVHSASLTDQFAGREPLPGHRWLRLEASFENHMPVDLILGLDYQEAVLIGSIERQLFLLVNGERVYRASLAEQGATTDSFVIPRIGDQVRFELAYPVPAGDLSQLSLRYYHESFQPIIVDLLDGPNQAAAKDQRQSHDLLELSVQAHQRLDEFNGVPAPEQMQWLVVDLRGRGLWTTEADARALDVHAALGTKARQPRVLEYNEAGGLLQARIDARHAYTREPGLGGLPANPAFLPEVEAGGLAVFPIPADAGRVELLAQFPRLAGREISNDIRPTLRFVLEDGPVDTAASETLLEIDDAPVPLRILAIERLAQFAGHRAGDSEELLLLTADHRNVSSNGGMMRISNRLGFQQGIELEGLYLRGPLALDEPYWLPPGNEPRELQILLRAPAGQAALEISYSGVSGRSQHRLELP